MPNRIPQIGDRVDYFPTDEQSKKCNFAKIMGADVVAVFGENASLISLKLRCDHGPDFTVPCIGRRSSPNDKGVWDWPPKKEIKSSKIYEAK